MIYECWVIIVYIHRVTVTSKYIILLSNFLTGTSRGFELHNGRKGFN